MSKITEAQAIEAANMVVSCTRQIKDLEQKKTEAETLVRAWHSQQIAPPKTLGEAELYTRRSIKLKIPNHVLIDEFVKALPDTCVEKKPSATSIYAEIGNSNKLQKTLRKFEVEISESAQVYCKAR